MRIPCIVAVGFFSTFLPAQYVSSTSSHVPIIRINLPSDVRSETVHINYYMSGSFGGYGNYVKAEKDRNSYEIQSAVEGKPAKNIKIIAYIPGCEMTTFDLAIENESTTIERYLECRTLATQSVTGKLNPVPESDKRLELVFSYAAYWSHPFFGIFDGPVTSIRLGIVVPNQDGAFSFALPDLARDRIVQHFPRHQWGNFTFELREVKTWNPVCLLGPVGSKSPAMGLEIQDSYSDVVEFTCVQEARAHK